MELAKMIEILKTKNIKSIEVGEYSKYLYIKTIKDDNSIFTIKINSYETVDEYSTIEALVAMTQGEHTKFCSYYLLEFEREGAEKSLEYHIEKLKKICEALDFKFKKWTNSPSNFLINNKTGLTGNEAEEIKRLKRRERTKLKLF